MPIRATIIKLLLRTFALFPMPVVHGIGAGLGWLLTVTPNELRRVSRINIDLCFPQLSASRRRRLLVRSLVECGKTAVEFAPLWTWSEDRILSLIKRAAGREYLDGLLDQGKGVILLIPHLGAWELASIYVSMCFAEKYPVTGLYRPPRMGELDVMIRRARERFGARMVPTTLTGVRTLYQTLNDGGIVGVLPDQEPGAGNPVFAPFLGVPANTMGLVSKLMARTQAAAVYVYFTRLPSGRGFEVHFSPASSGVGDGDLHIATQRLNEGVELCVKRYPEQYQWGYKRFRTRPPGESGVY